MYADITTKQNDIEKLCQKYHVRRLAIFGSALDDSFDPERSDLDFLVEFESMPPAEYADTYFGLLEELQILFKRPIDLVNESSLSNPWLQREIQQKQSLLYAA